MPVIHYIHTTYNYRFYALPRAKKSGTGNYLGTMGTFCLKLNQNGYYIVLKSVGNALFFYNRWIKMFE